MRDRLKKTKDGFINACLLGTCPEIKKENGKVLIRNSQKPKVVIGFSEKEWAELKKQNILIILIN